MANHAPHIAELEKMYVDGLPDSEIWEKMISVAAGLAYERRLASMSGSKDAMAIVAAEIVELHRIERLVAGRHDPPSSGAYGVWKKKTGVVLF